MWMPVLETLPAPAWFGSGAKLAYIVVVRLVSTLIANVFLWSGEIFYAPYTAGGLSDQAAAGAILMVEGSLVTFAAFAWLFLRLFAEGERRQELLEQGADARTVERAVRFGRADDLS
jgi:cytochrome c oxidase assembly factor CtaG